MFQKGQGGRPKGCKNKATREVQEACRLLVSDDGYRQSFAKRFTAGELPPPLEAMVWHYAYGKPVESVELSGDDGGPLRITYRVVNA